MLYSLSCSPPYNPPHNKRIQGEAGLTLATAPGVQTASMAEKKTYGPGWAYYNRRHYIRRISIGSLCSSSSPHSRRSGAELHDPDRAERAGVTAYPSWDSLPLLRQFTLPRNAQLYTTNIVLPMALFSGLTIFLTFCMEEVCTFSG